MARYSRSIQNGSVRRRRVAILLQQNSTTAEPELSSAPVEQPELQNTKPTEPAPQSSSSSFEFSTLQSRVCQPESMTWVFAGDLGYYTTSNAEESLQRRIEDHTRGPLGRDADIFVNATHSGARLNHVRKRIQVRFSQFQPDVVVVLCGFAECQTGIEKCSDFEMSFIALLKEIESVGAIPVVCTPPHSDVSPETEGYIDRLIFIEAIRGCVAEHSGILIDFWEDWENQSQSNRFWDVATRRPTQIGLDRMQRLYLHQLKMLPMVDDHPTQSPKTTEISQASHR